MGTRRSLSIMEIRNGLCRWPLGDPREEDFGYCGAATHNDRVYCPEHTAISLRKLPQSASAGFRADCDQTNPGARHGLV